jgi:hypothetical protein
MSHKFVKFPNMWRVRLEETNASGSTFIVALYLLDKACWSRQVRLGNGVLQKRGVSPRGKWRALKQLSEAGLIAMETRHGRPLLVTVRWTS